MVTGSGRPRWNPWAKSTPPAPQQGQKGWERPFRKTVRDRWVLHVRDHSGRHHPVTVDEATWHAHQVGDRIAADRPQPDRG